MRRNLWVLLVLGAVSWSLSDAQACHWRRASRGYRSAPVYGGVYGGSVYGGAVYGTPVYGNSYISSYPVGTIGPVRAWYADTGEPFYGVSSDVQTLPGTVIDGSFHGTTGGDEVAPP